MINVRDIHAESMLQDPEYRREYESLEEEFALIDVLVKARTRSGLTQAQVADRLGVSQPAVARIESGKNISYKALRRYASAIGCTLKVDLCPQKIEKTPVSTP